MSNRPTATLRLLCGATSDGDDLLEVSPPEVNVLVVSTSRSMTEVVRDWRSAVGSLPAGFGLVTFAEFTRSAAPADTAGGQPARRSVSGGDITLTSMANPGNLQRLGTAVTLYLDDWADSDRETVVYVDALSPLIKENDVESAFQFLHLLTRSVEHSGAALVVRLDPDAVEDRTANTLQPLFDHVADHTDDASGIDLDTIHDLLGNPRRRFVLRRLFEESQLGLDQLAADLARWENDTDDPTNAERERSYTALASIHVPRLAEASFVTFDRETERVRLCGGTADLDRLERLLNWPSGEE
ncbi:DUF7504 family protein [Haloplanus salilacus]|uniref:DUF7504 family protein n=1 Tax=Haloplanus salilacus TaxID=2949994 RepID=UPI0030CCA497